MREREREIYREREKGGRVLCCNKLLFSCEYTCMYVCCLCVTVSS